MGESPFKRVNPFSRRVVRNNTPCVQGVPTSLNHWFTRIDHSYNTRNAKKGKLKPLIYSTKKYGLYTFSNEGTKTLNLLKDTDLYNNSTSKKCFTNKLKLCFLSNY